MFFIASAKQRSLGAACASFFRRRLWSIASIGLALAAIGLDIYAKRQAGAGAMAMARTAEAISNKTPAPAVAAMRADADAVAHRVGDFAWAEFLVAGASVVCLSISLVKGEPGWKIVPVAVLIAYVLFASIQV